MGRDLAPYQAAIGRAEGLLRRHLASGRASADEIANVRRAAEIMKAQLAASPDHVLGYDRRPPDPRTGLKGPEQWTIDCLRRASDEIHPELASEQAQQAYVRKEQEYLDLGLRLVTQVRLRQQAVIDRQNGRSYLIQDNPLIPRIMSVIASELMSWVRRRPVDQAFLTRRAESGLADFLAERPDMVALLRLAQTLPADVEISEIPIERPAVVEAVELAIGLVPVVGNVVAAYEAYSGRDLFGYRLSDVERGVLAATVLLPLAGRLVKGGRVLYTEARLVALYGRDAAQWSRAVTAGGRLSANSPAVRVVEQAEVALRVDKKIGTAVAREAARALPRVVRGPGVAAMPEQAVLDLFRELAGTHRALATLDGPAMLRILEKGPNVDHLKGQVLEEVLESQVVPWLAQRAGSFALGLRTGGRPLEFVPGHLVRDLSGRQITDGILGVRNGECWRSWPCSRPRPAGRPPAS
ncbi:pre-toxin TG domain-containing protein [Nonomuraea thailandensis]